MERRMNYRLALKLGLERRQDGTIGHSGALGWSVIRLGGEKTMFKGEGRTLPRLGIRAEDEGEVRVVVYDREEDMLEAMTNEEFETRLSAALASLPGHVRLIRVPFDRERYEAYRAAHNKPDSHKTRAEWADQA